MISVITNNWFVRRLRQSPDTLCILSVPLICQQWRGIHQSQNNKDLQSSATPPNPMFQQLPCHLLHNLQRYHDSVNQTRSITMVLGIMKNTQGSTVDDLSWLLALATTAPLCGQAARPLQLQDQLSWPPYFQPCDLQNHAAGTPQFLSFLPPLLRSQSNHIPLRQRTRIYQHYSLLFKYLIKI